MNNKRYNQIIDEAYDKYCKESQYSWLISKVAFANAIKQNSDFAKEWGLKIEERELSEKERIVLSGYDYENRGGIGWNMLKETVDMDNSIPTKLITITYNNETIEIYE